MTSKDFYQNEMFDVAEELYNELSYGEAAPRTPSGLRIDRPGVTGVTAKLLRTAVAAGALTLLTLHAPAISGSSPRLDAAQHWKAEAAVNVPRLTRAQDQEARLFRAVFTPAPPDEDIGEEPDYDL